MKISGNEIKTGMIIEHNNDLWEVLKTQHVKPGKGAAFVRTKLKSLTSAKTLDKTFNAGEKVTTARVEKRPHQFLYKDDMGYNFMDTNTFEQIMIEEKLIERSDLLKDGQLVDILIHDETETPLSVELPPFVELMITYTEPGIKGDTATNALKPATVETGAKVNVPLFINEGDKIKIDCSKGTYLERIQ